MIRFLLSLLFRFVGKSRIFLYSIGFLKTYSVPQKVISIGNITVGGAGKTPMALLLNERLASRGLKTAIIEKGYKSGLKHKEIILAQKGKETLDDVKIGDEPLMIWNNLSNGTRLAIAKDKTNAAIAISTRWPDTDTIILDDGFQHLKLRRDVNLVLIDASLGMKDKLMPLGRLREPYNSLKRADIVLLTKSDAVDSVEREQLVKKINGINKKVKIFFSTIKFITSIPISGKNVFPVSAIYNPSHFHRNIREAGAIFTRYISLSDHYRFNSKLLSDILQEASQNGAESLIVTSKDLVKIRPYLDDTSKIVEAWYEHKIEDEEGFIKCFL
ncbi:MAG: tetraacyldisaccharide 4'-kinase [bacterium]